MAERCKHTDTVGRLGVYPRLTVSPSNGAQLAWAVGDGLGAGQVRLFVGMVLGSAFLAESVFGFWREV